MVLVTSTIDRRLSFSRPIFFGNWTDMKLTKDRQLLLHSFLPQETTIYWQWNSFLLSDGYTCMHAFKPQEHKTQCKKSNFDNSNCCSWLSTPDVRWLKMSKSKALCVYIFLAYLQFSMAANNNKSRFGTDGSKPAYWLFVVYIEIKLLVFAIFHTVQVVFISSLCLQSQFFSWAFHHSYKVHISPCNNSILFYPFCYRGNWKTTHHTI